MIDIDFCVAKVPTEFHGLTVLDSGFMTYLEKLLAYGYRFGTEMENFALMDAWSEYRGKLLICAPTKNALIGDFGLTRRMDETTRILLFRK